MAYLLANALGLYSQSQMAHAFEGKPQFRSRVASLTNVPEILPTPAATPQAVVTPPVKKTKSSWQESLTLNLKAIEASAPAGGAIGLYMKNLRTGKELSFRGDEYWYIASEVKVPVAIEILRAVDAGTLTLETKVEVLESDYIDGAGELNYIKPGSKVSVRMLLDQSLTFSDNTATDMLIRLVGLEKVNALTTSLSPGGFTPITTLGDVRRHAFSEFHPKAKKLTNMDFMKMKSIKDENAKIDQLARILKVKRSQLKVQTLDEAFEAYYSKRLNSATLRGFSVLLEKLNQGDVLKDETQTHLMDVLERIETGDKRIKAGLPKSFSFAHKTGTQHKRFCDMGILSNGKRKGDDYAVVACVRHLPLESAETLMKSMGQAIYESGAFPKDAK